MIDIPRCEYCGKFIKTEKKELGKVWDCKIIYSGYPCPEPLYDVFWHLKCKEIKDEKHGVK